MAARVGKVLTELHKSGLLWWLRPDGKTQVTIDCVQKRMAPSSKECAGYSGPETATPSMEEMNKLI
eukprot:1046942-Heterocapsa_arctica.AAC.1